MLLPYLHRVAARENLSSEDARLAMLEILSGEASTPQIAAFLVGLRTKGETADELLGFARAMREKAVRADPGADGSPLLDTCGTGGDGGSTFNISTIAAFVVAGAGVRVAKHGNRSLASTCGQRRHPGSPGDRYFDLLRKGRPVDPRDRYRIPVCAAVSSRHEARPAGTARFKDADGFQFARTAHQSRGRHAAVDRRPIDPGC